jgi:hypothetical protein
MMAPIVLEVCVDVPMWNSAVSVWPSIVMPQTGGGGSAGALFQTANCMNLLPDSCGPRPMGWHPVLLDEPEVYNPFAADTVGYTNGLKDSFPWYFILSRIH